MPRLVKKYCPQTGHLFWHCYLIPPAVWWEYPSLLPDMHVKIHTIRPELACAWKVQGLFEFWNTKGGKWRVKDLYDIYLITRVQNIDGNIFEEALKVVFEDRKTPFQVYERVLSGDFGQSKRTRKSWEKFVKEANRKTVIHSHLDLIYKVRKFLDPFFIRLLAKD